MKAKVVGMNDVCLGVGWSAGILSLFNTWWSLKLVSNLVELEPGSRGQKCLGWTGFVFWCVTESAQSSASFAAELTLLAITYKKTKPPPTPKFAKLHKVKITLEFIFLWDGAPSFRKGDSTVTACDLNSLFSCNLRHKPYVPLRGKLTSCLQYLL